MQIVLIAAQSADGFIARHETPGSGFASPADQSHFREALKAFDACVMGSVTYVVDRQAILSRLTPGRLRLVLTRDPAKFAGDVSPGRLEFTSESPKAMVDRLRTLGHKRCALLGGAQVHSLFLDAGLVDELWLTVEPLLFGSGVPLLHTPTNFRMRLASHARLDGSDTLLLKYSRH